MPLDIRGKTVTKSAFSEKYTLFRALLVETRQSRQLTQTEVANRLQKPQSFVSKYELGERRLDIVEFLEVAQALNVPAYEILRKLEQEDTILDRSEISAQELTQIVDQNPSLRGLLVSYIAETKLRNIWFSRPEITNAIKYDDHNRQKKGDLVITYKSNVFVLECKSLQTSSIKHPENTGGVWKGTAQCDASDRRSVKFPDGTSVETTCLLINEFDLLAINIFAFENKWRFVFIKNTDLPRSRYSKYTPEQRKYLLKGNINVSWPPEPPFCDEPFRLLDEIAAERLTQKLPEVLEEDESEEKIPVLEVQDQDT